MPCAWPISPKDKANKHFHVKQGSWFKTKTWEIGFVLLSNIQIGMWWSSHLLDSNVIWLDLFNFVSLGFRNMKCHPYNNLESTLAWLWRSIRFLLKWSQFIGFGTWRLPHSLKFRLTPTVVLVVNHHWGGGGGLTPWKDRISHMMEV